MNKIIKKILKAISFLLFLLPIAVGISLQSSAVQDFGVNRAVGWISDELGTSIQYTDVKITNFNRIRFDDLLISDIEDDTLLYASHTIAVFPVVFSILFRKSPERILMKKLELDKSIMKLQIDSAKNVNLGFIVDYIIGRRDTSNVRRINRIGEIKITDSKFSILNENKSSKRKGIDFTNMVFTSFDLLVKDLRICDGVVNMDIDKLSLQDKSGFLLRNLESHLAVCSSFMKWGDLTIETPFSNIAADSVNMSFDKFSDYSPPGIYDKVLFDLQFAKSQINSYDIGYFSDFFWMNSQMIGFSGHVSGLLSKLNGNDILMEWGDQSHLSGDFDMDGLPDAQETFLIFDLRELITNNKDLSSLNLPGGRKISLPSNFEKLRNFKYKGNFTGFFNDFVAFGQLKTNLGEIYTDVMFVPDSADIINFAGRLKAQEFYIGQLFKNEELVDDITIDAEINGQLSKEGPIATEVHGIINKFTINNYPYRNIEVDGTFSDKRFGGSLIVSDPNLKMEFNGLIDLAATPRRYDFSANIIHADFTALQISDSDPNYHASFLIRANAEGKNFDELNGEIRLLNSLFSKTNKQIQVYDLNLELINTEDHNEMHLRSDILDANISGQYKLSGLKDEILFYLKQFIPATIPVEFKDYQNTALKVNFELNFKRTEPFFEFFFPDYLISENSRASGTFEPFDTRFLRLDVFAPVLKVKQNAWHGFVLNLNSEDSLLITSIGSRIFNINDRIDLDNFSLQTRLQNNKMDFKSRWLNWDSTLYKGTLNGNVRFFNNQPQLAFHIDLKPSSVTISDTVWNINSTLLVFDSSGTYLDSLLISHDDQYFIARGRLSDIPGDSLKFAFQNFNLANLNFFTRKKDFELQGRLHGEGIFTGVKNNPLFFSSLQLNDMYVNQVRLGNCYINSAWNNLKQSLSILAEAQQDDLAMFRISGDYFPSQSGKMDFQISLNKLKTDIFNPFVSGVFSDMHGLATGDLQLTGIRGKPNLAGNIVLRENAFTIDYLKTRYRFDTELEVVNNNFILNNIEVFDTKGNKALLNGMIHTEYLKDLTINMYINANNLLCLNTRESDNKLFYGTAYANGSIRIKGTPSNLHFDIDASTGPETKFFIPLSEETEVSEYNYITLIQTDTTETDIDKEEIEYKVDLTGMQMDFNLDVTPDAEVQIIFDSRMGDIIKARGNGEMKMSINTLGTFDLVGDYTIEKGEYLFTMQDVINKPLTIESGSKLRWTGDPLDAQVDITAVYRARRVSLVDLFGTAADPNVSQGKVTVDCQIFLKGDLMSPDIKYDLYLPYSEEDTRSRVKSKITSEEQLTRQFLSLMVLNRFYYASEEPGADAAKNFAGVNAGELLSSQLSNWLSQISNEVDIGVNYRPGISGVTGNEVELALSTQLLNDRLSINGSVGTNAQSQNSNNYMGDIDIDYKLTKSGKWRARTFFRTIDDQITTSGKYVAGVGMFYTKEFDGIKDLFGRDKKKKSKIKGRREEEED